MEQLQRPLAEPSSRRLAVVRELQRTTVRFTADDWLRVRFAEAPAPLVEVALGVAELRRQRNGIPVNRWAARTRTVFPRTARPLLDLISPSGSWPTFIDPALPDLNDALDVVAATPKSLVRSELAGTWRRAEPPPTWVRGLADGDREAMRTLVRALRDFYAVCVAPCWPAIVMQFRADVAERMTVLARGGLGAVFGTLHRDLAWRDGALERSRTWVGQPGEFWLDGHGLQILASPLWTGPPLFTVSSRDSGSSAVVYAARKSAGEDGLRQPEALAALVGRTRAAVLGALRSPCSTAELAAQVGISSPSASEHAAVLRDADLIQTTRHGRGVQHSLTPLGRSLLNGH